MQRAIRRFLPLCCRVPWTFRLGRAALRETPAGAWEHTPRAQSCHFPSQREVEMSDTSAPQGAT